MTGEKSGRQRALEALAVFRRSGGKCPEPAFELDDRRERAMARAIYWGVLQNMALLDFYISSYSTKTPDALDKKVLDILRVGAYQILYFDRVPDRAAVYEAVEETKKINKGAASLVNAVLRRISENKAKLPTPKGTAAERLSVLYSHPLWFTERFIALLGEEECEAFLRSNNTPADLCIGVNTLKTDMESLKAALSEVPFTVCPAESSTLALPAGTDPMSLEPFLKGECTVQDPAARSAVKAAGLTPGMNVLDVCAAPGGKSFAAAMALENRGSIVSMDISEKKLSKISAGAKRLGIDIITVKAADARAFIPEYEQAADAVLADVPCSGLGTIRKKPDIRFKTAEEIAALPAIQRDIIENVCRYVKPGGVLLYSTCTVLPEENEAVTDGFLREHPEFMPEDFPGAVDGQRTLWPHRDGTDGFYIRKLRKRT